MNEQFGLLYATPSFLEGVARAIDIGDTLTEYNGFESSAEADTHALRSDWQTVGDDLRRAMSQYRQKKSKQLTNG